MDDTVSRVMGEWNSGPCDASWSSNVFYWSGAPCVDLGDGNCASPLGQAVDRREDFFDPGLPHFSQWDFVKVWQAHPDRLPTLRPKSYAPVIEGHDCATTASVGSLYFCSATASDGDANESLLTVIHRSNSCQWVHGSIYGYPRSRGTCQLAFAVTDGVFESALETVTVTVQ